ncbi:MAG: glycoside hydrolase family 127 protein, partial [Bacteroidales bacterium]|nr:glycoside hydrolase family 127 protein [Bacteroidales bacterium]
MKIILKSAVSMLLLVNAYGLEIKSQPSTKAVKNDEPGIVIADKLYPSDYLNAEIGGMLGQSIDSCIKNGVMAVNYPLYTLPFKDHTDKGGMFQGEFWGKWFTSAILAYAYQPEKSYKTIVKSSYESLINTQEQDGRISSYPRDETFVNWDIWGRKYALLGMMSYYELTRDKKALDAARLAVDELISISGPGKQKLTETSLQVLGSMSSTSILEPIVLIYKFSGEKKYLDFAEYLVSLWSEPNEYTDKGMRLIEDALAGVPPVSISSPKGYEMMSCFEGLCEMYRVTGNNLYLKAVVKFAESLLEREIMIVGSGSSAELWCDGAYRQTELLEQPMETCVTVTWIKLCYQLLRLTGDPLWADQMEVTLYNSLLGAMSPDGHWWAYFSPLAGERMPSPMQVPSCESSCCVANGPRGLLTVPGWSVMVDGSGPVINLYTPGQWTHVSEKGTKVKLIQSTDYPVSDEVQINVHQKNPESYTISLRIPAWSKNTEIAVNGENISARPGTYAQIEREWKEGDIITIKLDLRGRIIQSPGSFNDLAVMRGPVVLALDNRLVEKADYNLWLYPENTQWIHKDELGGLSYVLPEPVNMAKTEKYIELKAVDPKPDGVVMAFEVPFLYRYTHFFKHEVKPLVMCDYASAGNLYSEENLFRVWIPQPMFMNEIFPRNTWKILYREGEKRPEFPDKILLGSPENV